MTDQQGTMVPVSIPDKPDLSESDVVRDHVELPPNLAENNELAKKFHDDAWDFFTHFDGQDKRRTLEESVRSADAMWRASKRRDRTVKGTAQQQDTLSNVSSTSFYRSHRITTAGQKAVMFHGDELPAKYEPVQQSDDYTEEEGERVAEGQNLLLRYSWDRGQYEKVLKRALFYNNKYAQELLSCQWMYETQVKTERVPGYYTKSGEPVEFDPTNAPEPEQAYNALGEQLTRPVMEDGRPTSYVFVEKTRVVKDHPEVCRHDLKNVWFDLTIDDLQQQGCIIIRSQKPYSDLVAGQRDGLYTNVDKVNSSHLYQGSTTHDDTIAQDQADNIDEAYDNQQTGNYDIWEIWQVVPINNQSNRRGGKTSKTRGVWGDKTTVPEWYQSVYVGDFGQYGMDDKGGDGGKATNEGGAKSSCVCIQLRKNPYHHKRLPFNLIHSHEDDSGAVHAGYQTLLECLYEEETATINTHIDNKTLRNKKPWIGERGNVLSRNLKFKQGNQVLWVKAGTSKTALTRVDIEDTTQTDLAFLDWVDGQFQKTAGTDDPVSGEFAGARTTGTEFLGVTEKAMRPVLEDSEFISDQIFPWLLQDVAELWRQFGDPRKDVPVEYMGQVTPINPAELYGQLRTKVVSIGQFETDVTIRQTINNFIQAGGYDKAAQFMEQEGGKEFWKTVMRIMKMPDADKWFPDVQYREAENQAWSDYERIMNSPEDALQTGIPEEGENHGVHLRILKPMFARYQVQVPTEEQNPLTVQAFQLYILLHEQLQEEAAQQAQSLAAAGQAQETPALAGEAAGDQLAGTQGAVAV